MENNLFINLDDLYSPHIHRDKNKYKFYEEILDRVVKKIKKTNIDMRQLECQYTIPKFVFGGPIYDYEELKKYIIFKLKSNGLRVDPLNYETIYISWKPEDINRKRYEKHLEKEKEKLEKKYGAPQSKVINKTIKNKKGATDGALSDQTEIGYLQYNEKYKDMIPINPKRIRTYKPDSRIPTHKRHNFHNTMTLNQLAKEPGFANPNRMSQYPGSHLVPAVKKIENNFFGSTVPNNNPRIMIPPPTMFPPTNYFVNSNPSRYNF